MKMKNKQKHNILKRKKNKDSFFKRIISICVFLFLIINLFYRLLIKQNDLLIDISGSLIIIIIYLYFFKRWKQDSLAYLFLAFSLILHNMYLYSTTFLGIRFDHYMHLIGGFTLAIVVDRILRDKLSIKERVFLAIISASGIGALGEIIEWLGYNFLGEGDGFLLYGFGDEGEWQNATMDMIFNFFGGLLFGLIIAFKNNKTNRKINKMRTIR
jgi:uncharacterized membrane protein YjdF